MGVSIKNKAQILGETIDALQDSGVVTNLTSGQAAFIMAETAASHLGDLYASLETNTGLAFLSTARGPFIDLIADLFQIFRRDEQAAVVLREEQNIRFFVTSGALVDQIPSKVIAEGTEITSDASGVTYRILENTPFNDVATEVFVSAVSTGVGEDQNVGKGELTTHNLGLPDVFVTNNFAVTTATGIETDTQLRARVANAMLSRATSNTASVVEAVNVIPGVSEVRLDPYRNGPGTLQITVIPVSNVPSERLLTQVRLNVETVRSAGAIVDVVGPRYVQVEITVILQFDVSVGEGERPGIRQRAVQAILGYLNDLRIGQTFIVNEMIQRVLDVDDRILDLEIRCFAFRRRAQVLRNFTPDPDELLIPDPDVDEPIKVL